MAELPGTSQHQAVLRAIVDYYADDQRVLAVAVFGSLARGDWHAASDLDLDIVLVDGVAVDVQAELHTLCTSLAAIDEQAALIVPGSQIDSGDVVLASLLELSVRYHPLATTSPNIADDVIVLAGRLTTEQVRSASEANRQPSQPVSTLLDRWLRYAVEVEVAIRRDNFWLAVELLHQMRGLLLEMAARNQQPARPSADRLTAALQVRLGATLPQYSPASVRHCLNIMLDIVEYDLRAWTDNALELSNLQNGVLQVVRGGW